MSTTNTRTSTKSASEMVETLVETLTVKVGILDDMMQKVMQSGGIEPGNIVTFPNRGNYKPQSLALNTLCNTLKAIEATLEPQMPLPLPSGPN